MSKIFKNKILFSLITGLLLVILFASTFGGIVSFRANAASSSVDLQTNQNFTVSVYDRSSGDESSEFTKQNLNIGTCFVYNWADVSKIKFNYDSSVGTTPPKKYKTEGVASTEYYDLTISIEYLRGYKDAVKDFYAQEALILLENTYSTTVTGINSYRDLEENIKSFSFNIDEGRSGYVAGSTMWAKEWGIYRFKLLINSQETYSDFFVIEPNMEVSGAPKLAYTTTKSNSSLHDDYICSITDSEEFKYVDASKIKWYVTGKGEDGILYVLCDQDKNLAQFIGTNYTGLYKDYDSTSRQGLTFRFDDQGTSGSWEIWCEYNYFNSTEDAVVSKPLKITTGSRITNGMVVGIFIGVAVVAIVIAVVISVVKNKKEKVY